MNVKSFQLICYDLLKKMFTKKFISGTGCMVVTVSHAARRKPLVVGKPEPLMFDVLKQRFNLDPSRCLMVGDM